MDKSTIRVELSALANLSKFARDSKIPRRTLQRIAAGERETHQTTLMLVEAALRRLKPARKA